MTSKIKKFTSLSKQFSISYALCELTISACATLHRNIPHRLTEWKNRYIHTLLDGLAKQEPPSQSAPEPSAYITDSSAPTVWTLWLQGEEQAPPLVQSCIASMRHKITGANIIVLDCANLERYIGPLPESIQRNLDTGNIGYAHLSDYIRCTLLAQHGGIWMDSTVLCTSSFPMQLFDLPFYTYVQSNYTNPRNGNAWWKAFILGVNTPSPMFALARQILINYWDTYSMLIDYYLIDHILSYCLTLPQHDHYHDLVPNTPKDIYWLQHHAQDTWNPEYTALLPYINKLDYRVNDGTPKPETTLSHAIKMSRK